jgi:hypothetical protein
MTQTEYVLGGQVWTAAPLGCAIEWQSVIAWSWLPSWCCMHWVEHTEDAAWVTSKTSSNTAILAGKMRRAAE